MARLIRFFALLLSFLVVPAANASDWYEYTSRNFSVFSDAPRERVSAMMRELERFRSAALSFTGLPQGPENRRLRVYLFKNAQEFRRFSGDDKIAGFYRETWEGPLIFARSDGHGISGSGLIFHEYVHHLMREHSALRYPRWYSEGFAELLASADVRQSEVVIGGVPDWRLGAWLDENERPLTITELLNPAPGNDSKRYWNNYYASAWLLTHFLQLGVNSGQPDYREATNNYLNAVAAGEEPQAVFEFYFGMPIGEMQRALERYMQSEIYGYRYQVPPYDFSIPRRHLSDNESLFLLAERAQDVGDPALAERYLKQGEGYAPGWHPLQMSLALLKSAQGNRKFGIQVLEEIETQGLPSPYTAAKVAQWYLQRLQAAVGNSGWDEEAYAATVKYGRLAVQQHPAYLPGYRSLWQAYRLKGAQAQTLQVMMAAHQETPHHLGLNATIGFYLADIGKPELAREYLERVVAWSHSTPLREKAHHLLGQTPAGI